jgi:hypothetical protein
MWVRRRCKRSSIVQRVTNASPRGSKQVWKNDTRKMEENMPMEVEERELVIEDVSDGS